MKIFKITKTLSAVCTSKSTRSGFRHEATLLSCNYLEVAKAKICYLNRTWERFEFESVLMNLLDKTDLVTDRQKKNFFKKY